MPDSINPMALTAEQLFELLRRGRCQGLTEDTLRQQIDAGLPVNGDGTVNIVEYTAWLLREVNRNGSESGTAQAD